MVAARLIVSSYVLSTSRRRSTLDDFLRRLFVYRLLAMNEERMFHLIHIDLNKYIHMYIYICSLSRYSID